MRQLRTTHAALVAELGMSERLAYLDQLAVPYRQAVNTGRNLTFAEGKRPVNPAWMLERSRNMLVD